VSAAKVLIIGAGDAGRRIAAGLLGGGAVGRLTLADLDFGPFREEVDMLACCYDGTLAPRIVDGRNHRDVRALIEESAPDLIIQCASLISPWSVIGRNDDPVGRALGAAGLAVQLPAQLPIITTVMTVVRELGLEVPVANLSAPDIANAVLAARDLAPTIGLGNVSIQHLRARAALKARRGKDRTGDLPLLRIVGHHHHVYGVMQARAPDDPEDRPRLYLREDGSRDESLLYEGTPFAAGPIYNVITAASVLPVARALLPGAASLRFSAPAPMGLPGGYPVRIDGGSVALDLPAGVDLDEAVAFNRRIGEYDGVESIGEDGTVIFTPKAREALAALAPDLVEPLAWGDLAPRAERLRELVARIG
jgi:hypothetical protein